MDVITRTSDDAVRMFHDGFYCSEAILRAFEANSGVKFSDDVKRGMTAFVEGFGGSGCVCGALSASVFILSTLGGRLSPDEPTDQLEKAVKTLHEDFRKEFQSACCRLITRNATKLFGIGKYSTCPKTVSFCAMRIMEIAMENEWIAVEG